MRGRYCFVPMIVLLLACGDDGDGKQLATPQECNPLGGSSCIAPWPSSLYTRTDDASPTGVRVDIPAGALPTNIDDIPIEPAVFDAMDGFSSAAPMIIAFAGGIDGSNLVHYSNYAQSVEAASPTVLVDLETKQLVPHFAELDVRAADDPDQQALYIRPAKMLAGGKRYAVGIKQTLKARGGGELAIPEGWQAFVDGTKTSHARLEQFRNDPATAQMLEAFTANGIAKEDLVTAWHFTTASRASMHADLLDARTAALAEITTNGISYRVMSDMPSSDVRIARRIDGDFEAPLLLSNDGGTGPSTTLLRDANGKPMVNGVYRVPFTAIVPQCAIDSPTPVPLMIYGHGLLGDSTQVHSSGTRHAAAGLCVVVVGTDMRGMSDADVPNVALTLNDLNNGHLVFDVLLQGMINHIALVQIARGAMARQLFVKGQAATSIVNPDEFYYYGISQGGIMGTTVCGIDPVIRKCVVQVGAINYSMLLERSRDWPTYRTTLIGAYPNKLDVALILNLMQMRWDRTDPTVVADVITTTGFPDTPPKQILMQVAIADDEVPNIGSEYQARTMGIPTITPSPYVPYGTEATAGPAANGLVLYDFGLGNTIPSGNEAPPDNDVHSNIRNKQATIDMMRRFYQTGEIVNACTAPNGCDCAAGGCGAQL